MQDKTKKQLEALKIRFTMLKGTGDSNKEYERERFAEQAQANALINERIAELENKLGLASPERSRAGAMTNEQRIAALEKARVSDSQQLVSVLSYMFNFQLIVGLLAASARALGKPSELWIWRAAGTSQSR